MLNIRICVYSSAYVYDGNVIYIHTNIQTHNVPICSIFRRLSRCMYMYMTVSHMCNSYTYYTDYYYICSYIYVHIICSKLDIMNSVIMHTLCSCACNVAPILNMLQHDRIYICRSRKLLYKSIDNIEYLFVNKPLVLLRGRMTFDSCILVFWKK